MSASNILWKISRRPSVLYTQRAALDFLITEIQCITTYIMKRSYGHRLSTDRNVSSMLVLLCEEELQESVWSWDPVALLVSLKTASSILKQEGYM